MLAALSAARAEARDVSRKLREALGVLTPEAPEGME